MRFEDFTQRVKEIVEGKTGSKVVIRTISKNNRKVTGLTLLGEDISPMIYLEDLYASFTFEEREIEDVASEVLYLLANNKPSLDKENFIGNMSNPDYILANVRPCLYGKENQIPGFFEDVIGRDFLDMRIVYRVLIPEMSEVRNPASVLVSEQVCNMAGLSEEKLYERAIQNAQKAYVERNLTQMLVDMGMIFPEEILQDMFCTVGNILTVCSSDNGFYGAASMLCEEHLKSYLRTRGEEEMAILPSSTSEVLFASLTGKKILKH